MSTVQQTAGPGGPASRLKDGTEPADGRAARSHRSRRAIIEAMRALHAEGDLRPTAPRVAERAGVSVRTVWQQFADMETLLVEAIGATIRSCGRWWSGSSRISRWPRASNLFVGQRARILEQMTPTWRAARMHEPFSGQLQRIRPRCWRWPRRTSRRSSRRELAGTRARTAPAAGRQLARGQHLVVLGVAAHRARSRARRRPRSSSRSTFTALLAEAGIALTPTARRHLRADRCIEQACASRPLNLHCIVRIIDLDSPGSPGIRRR